MFRFFVRNPDADGANQDAPSQVPPGPDAIPVAVATPVATPVAPEGAEASPIVSPDGANITLSGRSQRTELEFGQRHSNLVVAATISAQENEAEDEDGEDSQRLPIDVSVVLDVSGSMRGEKLNLCKETLQFLLNELKPSDGFSLTTFASDVIVDIPMTRHKESAWETIRALQTRGSTNLSGGLVEGIKQIGETSQSANEETRVQAVLILTDGHANQGVQTQDGIIKIAHGLIRDRPIQVHTFGFGNDHNSDMLQSLAGQTGGNYYYVPSSDSVSSAFADCLGGLSAVVAQGMELRFSAADGTTINRVITQRKVAVRDATHVVNIGDIAEGETFDLLVEVDVSQAEAEVPSQPIVHVEVVYTDIISTPVAIRSEALDICVKRPAEVSNPDYLDSALEAQLAREEAALAMRAAREAADRCEYKQARDVMRRATETHKSRMAAAGPDEAAMLEAIERDLKLCSVGVENRSNYRQTKHLITSQQNTHAMQRGWTEQTEAMGLKFKSGGIQSEADRMIAACLQSSNSLQNIGDTVGDLEDHAYTFSKGAYGNRAKAKMLKKKRAWFSSKA